MAVLLLEILQLLEPYLPRPHLRLVWLPRAPSETQLLQLLGPAGIVVSTSLPVAARTLIHHPIPQPHLVLLGNVAVAMLFLELLKLLEPHLPRMGRLHRAPSEAQLLQLLGPAGVKALTPLLAATALVVHPSPKSARVL